MGLFDDIKFEMDCPECSARVTGFQSKDGDCSLALLEYWEVDNFYARCKKCGAWIEFKRRGGRPKVPITDFEMVVEQKR